MGIDAKRSVPVGVMTGATAVVRLSDLEWSVNLESPPDATLVAGSNGVDFFCQPAR
jgi:hypothetical protein